LFTASIDAVKSVELRKKIEDCPCPTASRTKRKPPLRKAVNPTTKIYYSAQFDQGRPNTIEHAFLAPPEVSFARRD
jgi:hypothetical protein